MSSILGKQHVLVLKMGTLWVPRSRWERVWIRVVVVMIVDEEDEEDDAVNECEETEESEDNDEEDGAVVLVSEGPAEGQCS